MQSSIKTSLAGLVLVALCGGAFYLASQKRGESILPPPAGNTSVEETQVAPLVRINTTTSTPTSCDGLSAEDKESCIKNKESEQVSAARTISDCAGLTLSKDSCEDTFRLRTAEINRNIDNCNDIVTEGVKVQCREKVTYLIATFDGRPDLCQNISADPSLGVLCKERANKVAASTQKLETNAKILTEAVSSGDENKCKTLWDAGQIIACLKPIMLQEKNNTLCKTILSDSTNQERCFNFVSYDFDRMIIDEVVAAKSTALCDRIIKSNAKEQCQKLSF